MEGSQRLVVVPQGAEISLAGSNADTALRSGHVVSTHCNQKIRGICRIRANQADEEATTVDLGTPGESCSPNPEEIPQYVETTAID